MPLFVKNTDNLQFSDEHVPLSIAVSVNLPSFGNKKFFFEPGNCMKPVEGFIFYVLNISYRARECFRERVDYITYELETLSAEAESERKKATIAEIKQSENQAWGIRIRYSSRYDLRALKHVYWHLFQELYKQQSHSGG